MSFKFIDGNLVSFIEGNSSEDKILFIDGCVYPVAFFKQPTGVTLTGVSVSVKTAPKTTATVLRKKLAVSTSTKSAAKTNAICRQIRRCTATSKISKPFATATAVFKNFRSTGISVVKAPTGVAYIMTPPRVLYCNNSAVGAQAGVANPTNIYDLTPHFSCTVGYVGSNVNEVRIQVSAPGDSAWASAVSWDSGWLTLASAISAANARIEDIEYGQLV
jgi:hypothetical protein